jgi:hypothetical protein
MFWEPVPATLRPALAGNPLSSLIDVTGGFKFLSRGSFGRDKTFVCQ